MKVVFRNLERSQFIEDNVREKITDVLMKFPDVDTESVTITVGMENGPRHPGADLFTVHLLLKGKHRQTLVMTKKSQNMYQAIAEVKEHLFELLHRSSEKQRSKLRVQRREKHRVLELVSA